MKEQNNIKHNCSPTKCTTHTARLPLHLPGKQTLYGCSCQDGCLNRIAILISRRHRTGGDCTISTLFVGTVLGGVSDSRWIMNRTGLVGQVQILVNIIVATSASNLITLMDLLEFSGVSGDKRAFYSSPKAIS